MMPGRYGRHGVTFLRQVNNVRKRVKFTRSGVRHCTIQDTKTLFLIKKSTFFI